MSKRLADDIAAFLSLDETYRDLKRLPDEFLERSRLLSGETVIQVALDLWGRGDQRNRWAAITLIQSHPTAFSLLRWRPLQEMGDGMGQLGGHGCLFILGRVGMAKWADQRSASAQMGSLEESMVASGSPCLHRCSEPTICGRQRGRGTYPCGC